MRKAILIAAGLLAGLYASGQRLVLNYDRPASKFEEALPIGNGHLGAMVYGGVADDLIWLNEGTLWGGSANPDNNPVPTGGPELLAKVRATLEKEDWSGARVWLRLEWSSTKTPTSLDLSIMQQVTVTSTVAIFPAGIPDRAGVTI